MHSPVIYDPEKPIAHYEEADRIYSGVKRTLLFGTVIPIAAFVCGFICIVYNPHAMALFALFGIPFTLLSIIGCQTRRPKMCMIAALLAIILVFVALLSGSEYAPLGVIAYIIAAFSEFRAKSAAQLFYELKKLPSFPLFDISLENISFAAMDRLGVEEFIDESVLFEEIEVKKYVPPEPPSDEMEEIVTEGMGLSMDLPQLSEYERETAKAVENVPDELKDEVIASLGHLAPNLAEYEKAAAEEREENADRPYERMVNAQVKKNRELSDVELFG